MLKAFTRKKREFQANTFMETSNRFVWRDWENIILTRVTHSYGHVIFMPVTHVTIIKPRQEGKKLWM